MKKNFTNRCNPADELRRYGTNILSTNGRKS